MHHISSGYYLCLDLIWDVVSASDLRHTGVYTHECIIKTVPRSGLRPVPALLKLSSGFQSQGCKITSKIRNF